MKVKIYPKSIFGYFGIIVLFRFISLFVDANLGMTLFVSFCVILCLSVILLCINYSFIKVDSHNSDIKVLKNEYVDYRVKVSSRLPISFCFVELKMKAQEYLKIQGDDHYIAMVDRENPMFANFKYKAAVFGSDTLALDYCMVHDFMGVIAIRKKVKVSETNVKTLPRYMENCYSRDTMIFSKYIADFDDSEEINSGLTTTSGFPGYEHREFVEGDSLKRVNYKISAKKDKLMVRLDEPVSSLRLAVILDNISSNDRFMDETTIEGMMSYVGCLMNNKITAEVYFNADSKKQMYSITTERDFGDFVDMVGNTCFYEKNNIKNNSVNDYEIYKSSRLSAIVIFSANGDTAKKIVENTKIPYHIITPNKSISGNEIFYIDSNLSISSGGVKVERN